MEAGDEQKQRERRGEGMGRGVSQEWLQILGRWSKRATRCRCTRTGGWARASPGGLQPGGSPVRWVPHVSTFQLLVSQSFFPFLVSNLRLSRAEGPGRTAATLKTLVPREQVEVQTLRTAGRVLLGVRVRTTQDARGARRDAGVQLQFSERVGRVHKPQAGDPDAAPRGWHGDFWKREGAPQGDGHTQVRPGSLPGQLAGQRGRPVWIPGPARALRPTGLPPANQGQCGLEGAQSLAHSLCQEDSKEKPTGDAKFQGQIFENEDDESTQTFSRVASVDL